MFTPTTVDVRNVTALKAKGWQALTIAESINNRIADSGITLKGYVAATNELLGAHAADGLGRITQLTRAAREINATGIVIGDHKRSMELDRLATILDQGYLGAWRNAAGTKISKATVVPQIAAILSEFTDSPADSYDLVLALKDELATTGDGDDTDTNSSKPDNNDDGTTESKLTNIEAPTFVDLNNAVNSVKGILESFDTIPANIAIALVQTFHNLSDQVVSLSDDN